MRAYRASARSIAHCVARVQEADRERYVCNLFLPRDARPAVFAVHALNTELARVREVVSEPTIRRMRMQWWRDALDGAARGEPLPNPIVEAVSHALVARPLIRPWLDQLIDEREHDLELVTQPEDERWVHAYADGTAGALLHAALEAVGVDEGARSDAARADAAHEAAAHIGRAHGIVTLLCGAAHHAAQGYTYLPRTLTDKHGGKALVGELLNGRGSPALRDAVRACAAQARDALLAGDALARQQPYAVRAALAPAAVCAAHLRALERAQYDVLRPDVRAGRLRVLAALALRLGFG